MITLPQVQSQVPNPWKVLIWDQDARDPRAVVVLCERRECLGDNMEWVTWKVNTIEGGAHLGHYFHDEQKAHGNYAQRRAR